MKKLISIQTIVAIGIGAALFFVLGRFVAIPCPIPNVTISIQYGVLAFCSAVYGPIAGLLIGFIGHFFIDFSWGWGVWYSWVIASGFFGIVMGLTGHSNKMSEGLFAKRDLVVFNIAQIISHVVAWVVIAPILDILIYAEPANKVFIQGLVSAAANIVTTGIIGSLLCIAFAAAKPKKGSLSRE